VSEKKKKKRRELSLERGKFYRCSDSYNHAKIAKKKY